jgi:hypothetical protein
LKSAPDPSFFDLDLATLDDFWTLYERFFPWNTTIRWD